MINKSKKHEAIFVKMLAVEIIKALLDKFISGEGWINICKKNNVQTAMCASCNKGFANEKNLNVHMTKFL